MQHLHVRSSGCVVLHVWAVNCFCQNDLPLATCSSLVSLVPAMQCLKLGWDLVMAIITKNKICSLTSQVRAASPSAIDTLRQEGRWTKLSIVHFSSSLPAAFPFALLLPTIRYCGTFRYIQYPNSKSLNMFEQILLASSASRASQHKSHLVQH